MTVIQPTNIAEVQELVCTHKHLLPRGGGSKTALSTPKPIQVALDTSALSGVLEYDPSEFVFVARAGTRLSEIATLLEQHGQYLPFDPPFVEAGATLGGTVAAGLSGPMRQRYGGVRDFVLGVKLVDGQGNLVQGGGKVVKNAAGFDLPKLMVGNLGRLGVMVELAFKVFPFPKATKTLEFTFPDLTLALEALYRLAASHFEFYALDLKPPTTLAVRIGGLAEALPQRLKNLQAFIGQPGILPPNEADYWQELNNLPTASSWLSPPKPTESTVFPSTSSENVSPVSKHLVKVALTPKHIPRLEPELGHLPHRYLSSGNLLYIGTDDTANLNTVLTAQGLSGLVLTGMVDSPYLGVDLEQPFATSISGALDPMKKFAYAT